MQGAKVPDDLVSEAMEIVGSTQDAVLGTPLFDRIGKSLGIDPQVRALQKSTLLSQLGACFETSSQKQFLRRVRVDSDEFKQCAS